MIKNIILDIGNVLGHFQWEKVFTDMMGVSGAEFDELAECTTLSDMWKEFDRGVLSDEEICQKCIKLNPGMEPRIREFFSHLGDIVLDFDYSRKWIGELHEAGYKVYILSNYGKTAFENCRANGCLAFVDDVDGALISYQEKMIKPDREIYERLLEKFNLVADECLFFDDLPENINGAEVVGIHGHVFVGYEDAKKFLSN